MKPISHLKSIFHLCTSCLLIEIATESAIAQSANIKTNQDWGKPVAGYSISITTKTNYYVSGEPINLRIAIKDVGTNTVVIADTFPLQLYDANVKCESKNMLPSPRGRQLIEKYRMSGESFSSQFLKPEEVATSSVNFPLSEVYDVSSPGTYSVSLTRELADTVGRNIKMAHENDAPALIGVKPDTIKWVKVTSNEIEVTVVPSGVMNSD